jgi:vacuolar-type H+-ATPase subunit E/Vma4
MASIDGEGCAIFYAHADLEVFRIRLGNALDFEFHEDNIGSLFSIRGPRNASALLDVERAFNKLEEVALKRRNEAGKPLILILNCMHLIRDNDEGRDLLELVQQRAELWAASNLATVIFNSDDYWIYERLKQYATRMNVIQVLDLNKPKAISALAQYRRKYREEIPDMQILEQVYNKVGGRLSYLGQIAKSDDMLKTANDICQMEKTWFLNQCWIHGREMDDDVIAQQKYALAAMVLPQCVLN